jgi:hypothetical protein
VLNTVRRKKIYIIQYRYVQHWTVYRIYIVTAHDNVLHKQKANLKGHWHKKVCMNSCWPVRKFLNVPLKHIKIHLYYINRNLTLCPPLKNIWRQAIDQPQMLWGIYSCPSCGFPAGEVPYLLGRPCGGQKWVLLSPWATAEQIFLRSGHRVRLIFTSWRRRIETGSIRKFV